MAAYSVILNHIHSCFTLPINEGTCREEGERKGSNVHRFQSREREGGGGSTRTEAAIRVINLSMRKFVYTAHALTDDGGPESSVEGVTNLLLPRNVAPKPKPMKELLY